MAFLFPPEHFARLDSPERLRRLPVDSLLACLPLKKGMRFVDLGCGTGTYFFPVFERLKGDGVFIAVELQEEMLRRFLSRLEAYAEHPGFMRIEAARAKPDRIPLPDSSADLILLNAVYHEITRRPAYLAEVRRVLSNHGTFALLDWKTPEEDPTIASDPSPMGPPHEARVSEQIALSELEDAGFSWVVSHSDFEQIWCLTARK